MDIAVDKIAKGVAALVSSVASSGALAPVLIESLKGVVLNVSWSKTNEAEKIVDKVFGEDTIIYLTIDKLTRSNTKGVMTFSKSSLHLSAKTYIQYITAKNDAAKNDLKKMKAQYVKSKLDWFNQKDTKQDQQIEGKEEERDPKCTVIFYLSVSVIVFLFFRSPFCIDSFSDNHNICTLYMFSSENTNDLKCAFSYSCSMCFVIVFGFTRSEL